MAIDTAPPSDAPVRPTVPAGETRLLGWAPGHTPIAGDAPPPTGKRPLAASASVLPELNEADTTPRPLWKHPAFLVSIGLTFVALVVAGVLIVLSLTSGGAARVSGLKLTVGDGNAHLTWSAGGAPADLFVVSGGDPLDLSQLVRGEEAWIPVGTGLFDDESCFVVRPSDRGDAAISLSADELDAQGAQSACVEDAAE